uniref:Uncharacterized protein n=1 Tax=Oryza sativa subsp. japonica TaxID=39947 RepID=Q8LH83_ORYSJ|nr:hypothetical protein [Oryza sativa Japonica Group]BAC16100.1 hypothetical protein [Oryza sativa Japonica Group]
MQKNCNGKIIGCNIAKNSDKINPPPSFSSTPATTTTNAAEEGDNVAKMHSEPCQRPDQTPPPHPASPCLATVTAGDVQRLHPIPHHPTPLPCYLSRRRVAAGEVQRLLPTMRHRLAPVTNVVVWLSAMMSRHLSRLPWCRDFEKRETLRRESMRRERNERERVVEEDS